jgi:hypothetical protein
LRSDMTGGNVYSARGSIKPKPGGMQALPMLRGHDAVFRKKGER